MSLLEKKYLRMSKEELIAKKERFERNIISFKKAKDRFGIASAKYHLNIINSILEQ